MSGRTIKVDIETLAKELKKLEGIGQKVWDDCRDLERRQNRFIKTKEGRKIWERYLYCNREDHPSKKDEASFTHKMFREIVYANT
jgi:hypothetical protein